MEERFYLYDILASEKALTTNMAVALNEASCDSIYKKYYEMFETSSASAKDLFNIAFNNGWYKLEEAEESKISTTKSKLESELQ